MRSPLAAPALRAGFVAAILAASGCVSVDVGKESAALTQFRLEDTVAPSSRRAQPIAHRLVVVPTGAGSSAESLAMLYSTAPQQRASYQYSTWSERPSQRFAQLLVDRVAARGSFESVALLGRGISGDLQLNVVVAELLHDAAAAPAVARMAISVELVERESRRLIARHTFTARIPVDSNNAAGAARALSRATSQILDELVPWLELAAANSARATGAAK